MINIPLYVEKLNSGDVLYIDVEINNQKSLFLFDTGSSVTIINKHNLDKYTTMTPVISYNISGVGDNVRSYDIDIDELKIGDRIIKNKTYQTIDLIDLNNMFSSNYIRTIDGILGNDIILDIISNVDIENKWIKLKKNT